MRTCVSSLCAIVAGVVLCGHVRGAVQTATWTGGTGNWHTASNWSPPVVPNNGGGTNFWADVDGGNGATASAVNLNLSATIDRLTIDMDDSVAIAPGATLTLLDQAVVEGLLLFTKNIGTSIDSILAVGGNVSFDGGGTIRLTEELDSVLTAAGSSHRLTNRCIIEGEGKVGANALWITNESRIEATTGLLEIDPAPGADGVVNAGADLRANGATATLRLQPGTYDNASGLIEAAGGGTVWFSNGVAVENTGGTIRAGDLSKLRLEGPVIVGGAMQAEGTGKARTWSGTTTLQDVGLTIPLEIGSGSTLKLIGTCSNANGITFEYNAGTSTDSILLIEGAVTHSGGAITMTEDYDSILRGTSVDAVLSNSGTIQGRGWLGDGMLRLVNQSMVTANAGGGTLILRPSPGDGALRNEGQIVASGGGKLILHGDCDNTGGEIIADDGSTLELQGNRIAHGRLGSRGSGVMRTTSAAAVLEDVELAEGQVLIRTGHTLRLRGGIRAAGIFLLEKNLGSAVDSRLEIDGNAIVDGPGGIALTEYWDSVLTGAGTGDRLTNRTTISGEGQLGVNALALTNDGLVKATTGTLEIDPSQPAGGDPGVRNRGTLAAETGTGKLILRSGSFDNTLGEIRATDGGVVRIDPAAVITNTGSIIRSTNAGRIELQNAGIVGGSVTGTVDAVGGTTVLTDVSLDGDFEISTGASVVLDGAITADGSIRFEKDTGTSVDVWLKVRGETVLDGAGDILLTEYFDSYLQGEDASAVLTNRILLRGQGQVGNNLLRVVNEGAIRAEGGTLDVDPVAPGDGAPGLANRGTMSARGAGAQLVLKPGLYDNDSGLIEASEGGVVVLDDASEVANAGGIVRALDGSQVRFENTALRGGNLVAEGSGLARTVLGTTLFDDVALAGTLRIDAGTTLHARNRLRNEGTILFEQNVGTSMDSRLRIDGIVALEGAGTLRLTEYDDSVISGDGASDRLVSGNRIEGAGLLGRNAMMFTNAGTVDANVAGQVLEVDPANGPDGVVNQGVLQASAGGILRLASGRYANAAGTVRADAASFVDLACESIAGGILETAGSGRIRTTATVTTLEDVSIRGNLDVAPGHTLQLRSTAANHGTILLVKNTGTSVDARLQIDGPTVLHGPGSVVMTERDDSVIRGAAPGVLLTNRSVIEGEGNLGENTLNLVNEGTLRADQSGAMYVDLVSGMTNLGTIEARGGGGFDFREPLGNAGTVEIAAGSRILVQGDYTQTAGATTADGILDPTGHVVLDGGTLGGVGVVRAETRNAATLRPGNPTGRIQLDGIYRQQPFGVLEIGIAGASSEQFGRVSVGGPVFLDGALSVSMLGGYDPPLGAQFEILTFNQLNGAFATELLPSLGGGARRFVVIYSNSNVVLSVADAAGLTYDQWKASVFTPAEQADPAVSGRQADPEGDGLPNAVEYAFAFDPKTRDLSPLRIGRMKDGGATYATVTFPQSVTATEATFAIDSSLDQSLWTEEPTQEVWRIPMGNADEVTLRLLDPVDGMSLLFLRLRINLP